MSRRPGASSDSAADQRAEAATGGVRRAAPCPGRAGRGGLRSRLQGRNGSNAGTRCPAICRAGAGPRPDSGALTAQAASSRRRDTDAQQRAGDRAGGRADDDVGPRAGPSRSRARAPRGRRRGRPDRRPRRRPGRARHCSFATILRPRPRPGKGLPPGAPPRPGQRAAPRRHPGPVAAATDPGCPDADPQRLSAAPCPAAGVPARVEPWRVSTSARAIRSLARAGTPCFGSSTRCCTFWRNAETPSWWSPCCALSGGEAPSERELRGVGRVADVHRLLGRRPRPAHRQLAGERRAARRGRRRPRRPRCRAARTRRGRRPRRAGR